MKKRILPLLLALVMTVTLIPAVAFAAPEVAPGGGVILNAVTDAWSPIPMQSGYNTQFSESSLYLDFSVSAYQKDSIIVCMEMESGMILRDTRVFLNGIGVPIRYALPGDCSFYDGLTKEELFAKNIKSIVIPTWVLALGKAMDPVQGVAYTQSKGTIELWNEPLASGKESTVTVYTLCFNTDFTSIPEHEQLPDVFPFSTTINADKVNIRTAPSITAKSLGKFAIGETVTVTAIEDNWAVVTRANGDVVFVHVAYLNKPYTGPIDGCMLKDSNLYSAATSVGGTLAVVRKGAAVTLLAREGTFFMIDVDGVVGYVYGPDVQTW